MEYIVNREEMAAADRRTAEEMHVPSAVLMERAALHIEDAVERALPCIKLDYYWNKNAAILIVAGPGNNGGDALASGRILIEKGYRPDFCLIGKPEKLSALAREQLASLQAIEPDIVVLDKVPEGSYDLLIDGLFGISLSRDVAGEFLEAVEGMNRLKERGTYIISVDIPSGIDSDTGEVRGAAVRADKTVVMEYRKLGEVLYPGAFFAGNVEVAHIGIVDRAFKKEPRVSALSNDEIDFPPRKRDSHKGSYGKVLIIAGSEGISGAALLSAAAALRSGCGMVRIFTHENNYSTIAAALPEALISTYRWEKGGESAATEELKSALSKALSWCDAVAIGPGIGTTECSRVIFKLALLESGKLPLVIDADGLNILADNPDLLKGQADERGIVLTPHLMEMSRLTSLTVAEIKGNLLDTARDFSLKYNAAVVLKDSRTVISTSDGRLFINLNGNDGMATAGSGDVLTGIIASLIAQGVAADRAAVLGAALHGRAGDEATAKSGRAGLIAGDIVEGLKNIHTEKDKKIKESFV